MVIRRLKKIVKEDNDQKSILRNLRVFLVCYLIRFVSDITVHIFTLDLVNYYDKKHTIYTFFVYLLWTASEMVPISYLFY